MNFHIDTEAFFAVLPYIGKGMLGIFALTAVIVVCIWLLGKIPSKGGKRNGKQ